VRSGVNRAVIAQVKAGILMQVPGQGLTRSPAPLRGRDTTRNRRRGTVPGARCAAIRDSPRDFGHVPLRVPGQGAKTTRVVADTRVVTSLAECAALSELGWPEPEQKHTGFVRLHFHVPVCVIVAHVGAYELVPARFEA